MTALDLFPTFLPMEFILTKYMHILQRRSMFQIIDLMQDMFRLSTRQSDAVGCSHSVCGSTGLPLPV